VSSRANTRGNVSLALIVRHMLGATRYSPGHEDAEAMRRALAETEAWIGKARADVGEVSHAEIVRALRLRYEANRKHPCSETARGITRSSGREVFAACKDPT
jgi:hypothetical protein